MSEDLAILIAPFLFVTGYSDRSVIAQRRNDLPEHDEQWVSVLDFVRRHGLVLAGEVTVAAPQPGKYWLRSVWTTPEYRRRIAAGEFSDEDLAADMRQIIGSLVVKYDLDHKAARLMQARE